eukprot:160597-Rhodomonas_salina.1
MVPPPRFASQAAPFRGHTFGLDPRPKRSDRPRLGALDRSLRTHKSVLGEPSQQTSRSAWSALSGPAPTRRNQMHKTTISPQVYGTARFCL